MGIAFLGCSSGAPGADGNNEQNPPSEEAKQPNFIIIVADDMGYADISCFGNTVINTPVLDKMAADGIRLADYHSNSAVSTPTRCALLTGRYQQRAGLQDVLLEANAAHKLQGLQPEEVTFAKILGQNGYKTAMFGKWHLGDLPKYSPVVHGFQTYQGFHAGNVDYFAYLTNQGEYDWYRQETLERDDKGYLTDEINERTVRFIEDNADSPFCIYVAHGCPHSPFQGPNATPYRTEGSKQTKEPAGTDRELQYKEMIEQMDTGIGWILDKLEEEGLTDNTFVVFVSDNGPAEVGSTGGMRGSKGSLFEGGHRVPGIIRMPDVIKAGQVSSVPVMSMDFFPTMIELAGIDYDDSAKPLDGVSLVPLMKTGKMADRTLFWRFRNVRAAREGDMKYIEGEGVPPSLYDLSADRDETTNLYNANKSYANTLRVKLDAWEKSVDSETPQQTR